MKKYLLPILLIGFWSCEEEVEEDTTPPWDYEIYNNKFH